jgi:hypothetical protein
LEALLNVNARKVTRLALLASLSLGLGFLGACKENPHDNARVPEPYTDKPVQNHRFDGGETDPYYKPGEGGGEGGGEKAKE